MSDHLTPSAWAMLSVLCGAVFLEGVDISMIGVALPSIRSDLGMSTASLQWVVSAYVLGYGGFVLLGGRAADLLGRRRMFLLWLGVFIVFSGLGGLATEGWVLILARFVTGVSAGFMTPAALSLITTSFEEGPARNRALLVYAGTAAGGFSLGLVFGGLLTAIDWRWVFFAPVVMAAVLLAAAAYALFLRIEADWSYAQMLPSLILLGLAFTLAYGALTIAATEGIAEEEQGLAGGLLNVSFQFGAALGLAVATAVNVAAGGSQLDAYRAAFLVPLVGALLGVVVTALGLSGRTERCSSAATATT